MSFQRHPTRYRVLALSVISGLAMSLPAAADFVGVSRCAAADGSNTPALHFIDGGNRFLVVAGGSGLTRSAIFNESAALEWARASGLFPEGTEFGNYDNYICGIQHEEWEPDPEPAPAPVEIPLQQECESDCQTDIQ